MSDEVVPMFNDKRRISAVNDDVNGMNIAMVGYKGVTRIEVYKEYGEQAHIPFIAVYMGDSIAFRRSAIPLTIYYGEGETSDDHA